MRYGRLSATLSRWRCGALSDEGERPGTFLSRCWLACGRLLELARWQCRSFLRGCNCVVCAILVQGLRESERRAVIGRTASDRGKTKEAIVCGASALGACKDYSFLGLFLWMSIMISQCFDESWSGRV